MTAPIWTTPQAIADAITQLIDENDRLSRELAAKTAMPPELGYNRPKLSDSEVKRIRYMKREGAFSNVQLADMFDVNPATISRTVRGEYHRSTK